MSGQSAGHGHGLSSLLTQLRPRLHPMAFVFVSRSRHRGHRDVVPLSPMRESAVCQTMVELGHSVPRPELAHAC